MTARGWLALAVVALAVAGMAAAAPQALAAHVNGLPARKRAALAWLVLLGRV